MALAAVRTSSARPVVKLVFEFLVLPRLGDVCAQRRRLRQRDHSRLGQPRLADCDGGAGRGDAAHGHRLLRLDAGHPFGNFAKLRAEGRKPPVSDVKGTLRQAAGDYRVWVLFLAYAACFGVELTIYNIAAIYYHDQFGLSVAGGGVIVGLFGLTNLFARALGGITGDKVWLRFGLRGRMVFLGAILLLEGAALLLFAKMSTLALSIAALVLFGVFVQMSEGATYSVVPFINRRALGSASGIVGAGGNAGGFGFLFRAERIHAAFRIVLNALRRH